MNDYRHPNLGQQLPPHPGSLENEFKQLINEFEFTSGRWQHQILGFCNQPIHNTTHLGWSWDNENHNLTGWITSNPGRRQQLATNVEIMRGYRLVIVKCEHEWYVLDPAKEE